MRFTPVVVAGLLAVARAADSTTASASAAPTSGLTTEQEKCIADCDPEDVVCLAHCAPVPSPDEGNLEALHKCVGECDQGDGSESQTVAYSNCVQECVVEHYYEPGVGTPGQGQSGSGSGSGSGSDDDDDDDSDSNSGSGSDNSGDDADSDSESGSGSNSGDEESGDGDDADSEESGDGDSAASGLLTSPVMGLFGLAAAVLAF